MANINFFKNLNLKKKFLLFTGMILFLFLLMLAWNIYRMNKNINFLSELSNEQELAGELISIKIKHQEWMNDMTLRMVQGSMGDSLYITEDSYKTCAFGKWYAGESKEQNLLLRPELVSLLAQTDSAHQNLHRTAFRLNQQSVDKRIPKSEVQMYFLKQFIPKYREMQSKLNELTKAVQTQKRFDDIYSMVKKMGLGLIILFVIALGVMGLLIVVFIRDLTTPLHHINEMAKRIADGNLTQDIDYSRRDEFGEVIDSMNKMVVILQNVMESVADSVDGFVEVSEMVDSGAQRISETTSRQAASVEEVMAAMEQMQSSIAANTSSASDTESIAEKVTENAEKGNVKINEAAEMLKEIAKKITVVSEVAYQSNILSLNASIEASRAGDAGKGFAVVAFEIGNLAEQSKISADSIEKLSHRSIEVANESQLLFQHLLADIEKTYSFIMNMVTAGLEQENGANQVNLSVSELNQAAQKNASDAQNLAENASSMKEQIEMLQEMVKHFST